MMIPGPVTHRRMTTLAAIVSAFVTGLATADEPAQTPPEKSKLSAPQAVRRGNDFLLKGDPAAAMQAYTHAEELAPDAPEIAFVQGLAHYDLQEMDKARDAFRKAATSSDHALADDALYSLGTCDHAEALQNNENPKESLNKLESAMRHYRNVLLNQPDHKAALDANFKAASMWRQLKQQLQQQEQQKGDEGEEGEENEDQEKQDSKQNQEGDEDKEEKEGESSDQQDKQDEQPSQEQKSKEQQAKEQKEQVSREQAERKLREMMQAMRDREKARKPKVQKMPASRAEKDW